MGKRKSPEEIADLISKPTHEYQKKWNEPDRNKVTTLKRYYLKQLAKRSQHMEQEPQPTTEVQQNHERLDKIAELLERSGISLDEVEKVNRVNVYQAAMKGEDGEWSVRDLYSVQYTPKKEDIDDIFPQVESARIRPTKRKRAERLGSMILGYGDGQVDFRIIRDPRTLETEVVPLQNLEMHRIILQMNAHYQPEVTINGGDFGDFSSSSRFPIDSDHFNGSMTLAMQWIHNFYAQIVADNPNAEHVEVSSNHGDRPRKKILKEAPEFYNFYRPGEDYPAWTYYSMARLGELGIKHISGYPQGEYIHGDPEYPQILFKHGSLTGNNAVYKEADKNPTINVVRWHNHGERMIKRTTRQGEQLFYLILGSSCINNSPVPGYSNAIDDFNQPVEYHNQDHVNSFVMIRDYGKGRFEPVTIDVVNGKAYYDGMEWDGSQPYEWEYNFGYIKEIDNE